VAKKDKKKGLDMMLAFFGVLPFLAFGPFRLIEIGLQTA
jgi:hypothetical protein